MTIYAKVLTWPLLESLWIEHYRPEITRYRTQSPPRKPEAHSDTEEAYPVRIFSFSLRAPLSFSVASVFSDYARPFHNPLLPLDCGPHASPAVSLLPRHADAV